MKILFVSNLYPPNIVGGYEVLCADVARDMVRRGHEVSVLTSCYGGQVAMAAGQTVHQALQLLVGPTVYDYFDGTASQQRLLEKQNATALRHAVSRSRPDVVFSWNLYGLGLPFFDVLTELGFPLAVMLTDNWLASMLNPDHVGKYFRNSIYGGIAERLPQPAAAVRSFGSDVSAIFGSHFMQEFYGRCGIHFQSARTVHNGVELATFDDEALVPRDEIGAGDPIKLLFAGRVVEIKGAHTAIEALGKLNAKGGSRSYKLHIVGDTRDQAYLARLQALAEQAGCTGSVEFSPPVEQSALFDLFQAHDVYLFPSLYEPFSLTLIHALSAGIPTVASNAGGNVEIIDEEKTGLLFEAGDASGLAAAVSRLADDDALRSRVARGGRSASGIYSAQRMLDGMEEHLSALVKSR